jgi:3-hydroxybutyryl-CoA dehydrogenase
LSGQHAAVIGAGTMGHAFANLLAARGHQVELVDRTLDLASRGKEAAAADLAVAIEEGFVPGAEFEAILGRIRPREDLRAALPRAGFVIEAVPEDLSLKLDVWRLLDRHADDGAILASNTSSIDINEIAAVVKKRPERVIGTHWYNPPHIVPCVEVVPADVTSRETVEATLALLRDLGKHPAVTKSVPGFVGNRIQLVMAAEAFRCVEEGIATPEDVDAIVRGSFGFRLGAYGPLRIADLAGLDTYLGVYDYLSERCGDPWYAAPELLRGLVARGRTGLKSGAGIYDYSDEEARQFQAERDRLLYRHLRMYLASNGDATLDR